MLPRYPLESFKNDGIYDERPGCDDIGEIGDGENRIDDLSPSLQKRLNMVGGGKFNDPSLVDSGVMKSLLEEGLTPADAAASFIASKRGDDARERKDGHFEDYVQRTVSEAASVVGHSKPKNKTITVDFGRAHDPKANLLTDSGIIEERVHLVPSQSTEWIWKPYIPAGRITILAGDPDRGKSTIAIDLVARLSRGAAMPDSQQRTKGLGTCAIATAEDNTAETIRPRLEAAGADLTRVRVIRKLQEEDQQRFLSFPKHLQQLHDYIVQRGIRMFVIDPMNAFIGSSTDTFKDHDVRLALSPIEEIAERTGCSFLMHVGSTDRL